MRLFIGIELPADIKHELLYAREAIRQVTNGRYPPEASYHITLSFIGEVAGSRIPEIADCMYRSIGKPIDLHLDTIGSFKSNKGAILWAGVGGDISKLSDLSKRINAALTEAGFSPDLKPFKAHITLGRQVELFGQTMPMLKHLSFVASAITLFSSERSGNRLEYVPLERVELSDDTV